MSHPQDNKASGVKRTLRAPTSFSQPTVDESGSFHSFRSHLDAGMRDTSIERSVSKTPTRPKVGNRATKTEANRQTARDRRSC